MTVIHWLNHKGGETTMRGIWAVIVAGAIVAGVLLVVMGLFWIIELAPLMVFFGIAVAYGVLSSNASTGRRKALQSARNAAIEGARETLRVRQFPATTDQSPLDR